MRCAVLACVAFETVKVVRPAAFYGADEVHLFHYSRSSGDIYGKFYSEVVRLLKAEVPGARIVEHSKDPVYDFPAMLRALLDCISKAEAEGCERVLVNASSGPAQFTAAAVVASFMTGARAFTVGTKEYTVPEKDIENLYFRDGSPVGLSGKIYDPRLITNFPIKMPDENLVRALRVYRDMRNAMLPVSASNVIAALKEEGLWNYSADRGSCRTSEFQKEAMYYQRHFIDEWKSRGWVSKKGRSSKYDLTEDGRNIADTFYNKPRCRRRCLCAVMRF